MRAGNEKKARVCRARATGMTRNPTKTIIRTASMREPLDDGIRGRVFSAFLMAETEKRSTTEIFTRAGGIFWGIVLLIVGLLWLLAAMNVIQVDVNLIWPVLVILGGIYLLVTKLVGSPFPPAK